VSARVKHFLSALLHALREKRHFALMDGVAFPTVGSLVIHSGHGMAQQVFPLDDAPGPEDSQGHHGAALGDWSLLDVAQGVELRVSEKVRFARGPARTRPWCTVKHGVIDWAARSSFTGEFELVIMIEVVTEEMHGSDRVPGTLRCRYPPQQFAETRGENLLL